jgi:hypothetical protein
MKLVRRCLVLVTVVAACGPTAGSNDDDDDDDDIDAGTDCPGCVCEPGTGTCNGNTSHYCRPDGSGFVDVECDPVQGSACNPDTGLCTGPCAPQNLGETYIGCEYYPTNIGNMVASMFQFAVAVSNTANEPAMVTIDRGGLTAPMTFAVAARSVAVQKLPWVTNLKLCNGTPPFSEDCMSPPINGGMVPAGAFRLRSTLPVTVYQFSPLDYTNGAGVNSYTNDASLLFPINVWRDQYYAVAWPTIAGNDGFGTSWQHSSLVAVTAYQADTMVTIVPRVAAVGDAATSLAAGTPFNITLGAGDVFQISAMANDADLTGSLITSSKPIQVISGHYCANVPDLNFGYCDHLEESMFPVQALATEYIVHAPAVTTIPAGKENVVKIIATEANTMLTYEPDQVGAPTMIVNAGDAAVIARQAASYRITANHKVIVVQYMEGSTAGGGTGDPAMALAVPIEQYRDEYLFHAPTNYETNYVDITAPTGASVTLDGYAITSWQPIGTTGYSLSRVTPLGPGPASDGNHSATGNMPFGITVYGYGQDTSYWYPGGLDLVNIPVE